MRAAGLLPPPREWCIGQVVKEFAAAEADNPAKCEQTTNYF